MEKKAGSKRNFKFAVIETSAPSDADYEMITDQAIHNTIREYRQWGKESKVDMEFEISYSNSEFENQMVINACFENEQDYKDFYVCHVWNHPKTKLELATDEWHYS